MQVKSFGCRTQWGKKQPKQNEIEEQHQKEETGIENIKKENDHSGSHKKEETQRKGATIQPNRNKEKKRRGCKKIEASVEQTHREKNGGRIFLSDGSGYRSRHRI